MSSVTNRIKQIEQPYGGYIQPSKMDITVLESNDCVYPKENIHGNIIGMVVDYMTRMLSNNTPAKDAFRISIYGAIQKKQILNDDSDIIAMYYCNRITELDDQSIINACKLVTFDAWYRNPLFAGTAKQHDEINPDSNTIHNIRVFISRSLKFFEKYGPITKDGITFNKKAFTNLIDSGDGDFLTRDTLWDFKVSKRGPNKNGTLQVLVYFLMGKHSSAREFKHIERIGLYNPRLNKVYLQTVSDIPMDIINMVEKEVIGYNKCLSDSLKYLYKLC